MASKGVTKLSDTHFSPAPRMTNCLVADPCGVLLIVVETSQVAVVKFENHNTRANTITGLPGDNQRIQTWSLAHIDCPRGAAWAPDGSLLAVACKEQICIFSCERKYVARLGLSIYKSNENEKLRKRSQDIKNDSAPVSEVGVDEEEIAKDSIFGIDSVFHLVNVMPLYYIPKDVSVACCYSQCEITTLPPTPTFVPPPASHSALPDTPNHPRDPRERASLPSRVSCKSWYSIAIAGPDGVEVHNVSLPSSENRREIQENTHTCAHTQATHLHEPLLLHESLAVAHVTYSRDGKRLAVASYDGHIGIWCTDNARRVATSLWFEWIDSPRVTGLSFSPCVRYLAIGYWGGAVDVFQRHGRRKWDRFTRLNHTVRKEEGSTINQTNVVQGQVRVQSISTTPNSNIPGCLLEWRALKHSLLLCTSQANPPGLLEFNVLTNTTRFLPSERQVKGVGVWGLPPTLYVLGRAGKLFVPHSGEYSEVMRQKASVEKQFLTNESTCTTSTITPSKSHDFSCFVPPKHETILHHSVFGTVYKDIQGVLYIEHNCDELTDKSGNEVIDGIYRRHQRNHTTGRHMRRCILGSLPFLATSGSGVRQLDMNEHFLVLTVKNIVYVLPRDKSCRRRTCPQSRANEEHPYSHNVKHTLRKSKLHERSPSVDHNGQAQPHINSLHTSRKLESINTNEYEHSSTHLPIHQNMYTPLQPQSCGISSNGKGLAAIHPTELSCACMMRENDRIAIVSVDMNGEVRLCDITSHLVQEVTSHDNPHARPITPSTPQTSQCSPHHSIPNFHVDSGSENIQIGPSFQIITTVEAPIAHYEGWKDMVSTANGVCHSSLHIVKRDKRDVCVDTNVNCKVRGECEIDPTPRETHEKRNNGGEGSANADVYIVGIASVLELDPTVSVWSTLLLLPVSTIKPVSTHDIRTTCLATSVGSHIHTSMDASMPTDIPTGTATRVTASASLSMSTSTPTTTSKHIAVPTDTTTPAISLANIPTSVSPALIAQCSDVSSTKSIPQDTRVVAQRKLGPILSQCFDGKLIETMLFCCGVRDDGRTLLFLDTSGVITDVGVMQAPKDIIFSDNISEKDEERTEHQNTADTFAVILPSWTQSRDLVGVGGI
eukprot:CFRG4980T1